MKRFLLCMVAVMLATVSMFAQKQVKSLPSLPSMRPSIQVSPLPGRAFAERPSARRAPMMKEDAELVTPPDGAEAEDWYVEGVWYMNFSSGWANVSDEAETLPVIVSGSDFYIQGLAYWFPEAWIKGTLADGVVTFPESTFVGEDEYGAEYLVGSEDGSVLSNIVFSYDEENQLLECQTYIFENAYADKLGYYGYWASLAISKNPIVEPVVEAPEDLETGECILTGYMLDDEDDAEEVMSPVFVGIQDGVCYIQGTNPYIPEAWIAGTVEGNKITFPAGQYYGKYYGQYKLYLVGLDEEGAITDVVFTLNDEGEEVEMTTTNLVGISLEDPTDPESVIAVFSNVKIVKIKEKAGTPSDPEVSYDEGTYGPYLECYIPLVDTDGNYMLPSKLTYKVFKDIKGEVSEHTFVAGDYYEEIEENMTEIPYWYTDDYDIYPGAETVYLYGADVDDWNRVGLQVTYYGQGEVHSSEIVWVTIKSGNTVDYSFDFNAMDASTPVSTSNSNAGDITEDLTITEEDVSLIISPSEANTQNRWWKGGSGIQLRVYGGTLTFETASGDNITKIEFYYGKWDSRVSCEIGTLTNDTESKVATWKGSSPEVVIDFGKDTNSQLNKVVVYVDNTSEATAIENVTRSVVEDGVFYNLAGQRVSNPQRGIYIVNGKKVLVK